MPLLAARLLIAFLWAAWLYPFAFRAPHHQNRESITVATPTRIGLLLECVGIALACIFGPDTPAGPVRIIAALVLWGVANVLAWKSIRHLGKQFRLHAGLYKDHALVRSGPYAVVRHPIYASLFAMLLCSALILAPWPWALAAIAVFVAGTEIRVQTEDKLLESRFGDEFRAYQKSVPAYVPFVR